VLHLILASTLEPNKKVSIFLTTGGNHHSHQVKRKWPIRCMPLVIFLLLMAMVS